LLGEKMTINTFEHKIGLILARNAAYRFDDALQRAGIGVEEKK